MRKFSIRLLLQWTLGTLIVCYTLLIFALDNSSVQRWLAEKIEIQLEDLIHSDVEIGSVEVGLFNNVSIHNLVVKDRNNKTLLNSKLTFAKIELRSLLKKQISLRNIALLDTKINLYKATAKSNTNFQYILDAFKGDGEEKSSINLRINSLILRRCEVSYHALYKPSPLSGEFSPHHVDLTKIEANLSLKCLTPDSLNLRIRQFEAQESCGLAVRALRLRLTANRHRGEMRDFYLKTDHSEIEQRLLTAKYDASNLKTLGQTLLLNGELKNTRISSQDVAPFVPKLTQLDEDIVLSTRYSVSPKLITAHSLNLHNQNQTLTLVSDITLRRQDARIEDIFSDLHHLEVKSELSQKLFHLFAQKEEPQWLKALGDIQIEGKAKYSLKNNILFNGNISSNLGILKTNIAYKDTNIQGEVSSVGINPSLIAQQTAIPTLLDFEAKGNVSLPKGERIHGEVDLKINKAVLDDKTLQHLQAQAELNAENGSIEIQAQDPFADFTAKASANLSANWKPSNIQVQADIRRLLPAHLGLTQHWGDGAFSLQAKADLNHLDLSHPQGKITIQNLRLDGDIEDEAPYFCHNFDLTAIPHNDGGHLTLRSDFADLEIDGPLDIASWKHIGHNLWKNWTHKMQPENAEKPLTPHLKKVSATDASLALAIKRTDFFRRIVKTNVDADQLIIVNGSVNSNGSALQLTAYAPDLKVGNQHLTDLTLSARSKDDELKLLAKLGKPLKNAALWTELDVKAENGKIHTQIEWDERLNHKFLGKLETTTTLFLPQEGRREKIGFTTDFHPTIVEINDSVWNVEPGRIRFSNDQLNISNLSLSHADQRLAVAGSYAQGSEGIVVDLRKVDVGYAIAMTGLEVVTFGGHASGRGILRPASDGSLQLVANLDIPNFRFNNTHLGHAEIQGGFDGRDQTINLDAKMKERGTGYTNVLGFVSLGRKELDLRVEGEKTPIAFLNKYIDEIFHDIRGRATGRCRIFGDFKHLDFEGYERASASAKIPVNGVTYHLNDAEVNIVPGMFEILRANVTDSIQGTGTISGKLHHSHLHDMVYDFSIQGERIKLYDRPYELDMPFYSTAYGTGDVRIWGKPGRLDANIRVATDEGSVLTYLMDSPEMGDQQLLTFRELAQSEDVDTTSAVHIKEYEEIEEDSKTDIRLNIDVNVRPNSVLRMITDIKSGDVITVRGSGPIQASYYNKGAFQMYGTYNVVQGNYDLSIQNLIKKNFALQPGGTVNFSGDPMNADVNVQASYLVNSASLADLNISSGFTNNTTPVNCLINFTGKVSNMDLALDFDLPNVGEDEKMMVRNLIASEEDRTMQVLYLLGVGRFFTYDYSTTESAAGQSQSSIMMKSLLTNTLSSQINNIIANAMGTSNWTFGANVATGQMGWSDMEVDGSLSGRLLNNRLLVNGKVGYHERQAATTNFVGDFDVHYLLTPSGSVNLKAYSETNDRYFSKSTLTTQGVGIQLKRDFTSLRDLFSRKRKTNQKNSKNKQKNTQK